MRKDTSTYSPHSINLIKTEEVVRGVYSHLKGDLTTNSICVEAEK